MLETKQDYVGGKVERDKAKADGTSTWRARVSTGGHDGSCGGENGALGANGRVLDPRTIGLPRAWVRPP